MEPKYTWGHFSTLKFDTTNTDEIYKLLLHVEQNYM